ncbi:hypothetical protein NECAME_08956 [Necator americanus]|uniref:Uncharacterized protein n=1 Tax=Necator americanus TaxID=51031 RepID=W2TFE8_NECAM|nr:hypothetical protein NECAME_08956 [Necator americanus]ETN80750.1 hypothetical protein NECAME_08956 [Necator americanus]
MLMDTGSLKLWASLTFTPSKHGRTPLYLCGDVQMISIGGDDLFRIPSWTMCPRLQLCADRFRSNAIYRVCDGMLAQQIEVQLNEKEDHENYYGNKTRSSFALKENPVCAKQHMLTFGNFPGA